MMFSTENLVRRLLFPNLRLFKLSADILRCLVPAIIAAQKRPTNANR